MVTVKKDIALLISRLKNRDKCAVSTLYDMYAKALYNVMLRIVKSPEVAEDLLQESFIKIWMNFDSYDAEKGALFTWMLNICRNLAIDHIRSSQNVHALRTVSTEDGASFYADHNATIQPDYIGIKELVMKLTPGEKEVVDMLYFSGYTHSEAAEELNVPLGTIKTRARSALKILRQAFDLQH